jgi:hypothetical protein
MEPLLVGFERASLSLLVLPLLFPHAVFLVLYLLEPTSDAALLFYGASMWLASVRGYAGCEVLAASNWLLGRDDQVGCALFWPVDQLEHHRTGQ